MLSSTKSESIGLHAVPYTNSDETGADITVISPVKDKMYNLLVTILHVTTWITAIVLSFVAHDKLTNVKFYDVDDKGVVGLVEPSEACKALSLMQCIMAIVSFLFTALYGALVDKKDPPAPILGALLLAAIVSTIMISGANVTVTTVVKDMETYNFSLDAGIMISTASSMVFAFYIHFAKSANGAIDRLSAFPKYPS